MKIKNKQGHIITVPSHLEDIVRNHINSGNHSEVDNIIKMEQGGPVEPTMINVEKDELLVSPDTKILKEYINKPEHPESGINPKGNTMEQPGNFVIPKKLAKLYKEGDRLRRQTMLMNLQNKQAATNKMEEGGKVNYGMLASSIGGAFQNLGANRSAKAQSPDYGQNMYSTDYSRNMQMGNQIGDGIGAAIPIAGAFKGLGQGASNLVAPSDQYGVRKGSTAQVGIASAIDPLPVTAEAVSNISQGKELGQSAYAFINPIKAGVDMNERNKANREKLKVWSEGQEMFNNLSNSTMNKDNIRFGKGGRIPKMQQGGGINPKTQYPDGSYRMGDYSDPTGNKDWSYNYTPNGWEGLNKGKRYNLSDPKYKSTTDLLTNTFNDFQKAGGGGSGAWDNYLASKNSNSSNNIQPRQSLGTNNIPNSYSNPQPVQGKTLGQYNARRGQKNAGDQFNWNKLATGLNDAFLNTMGPASYLREQGKNYDTVKYPDANPNLINDNEQLREADLQNAAYNKDIMSASGGNSGTYLANRLAGLTRNLMNKNRIRENTANTNTQIKNQFNLYNNASKARAIDATAANKGQSLTNYYSAMGNMGKNLAGTSQTIDGRDHQMDLYKVMLQMFPSLNK